MRIRRNWVFKLFLTVFSVLLLAGSVGLMASTDALAAGSDITIIGPGDINHPIEITQNTAIKAFVTGPGRADSDIVTFEYTIPSVAVTGVSIAEGDQELEEGQTIQLSAVVEPADATNKNVTWSSSDENIAAVDGTGLVTAVAEGTATITVTTTDGSFTDNITVTVGQAAGPKPAPVLTADTTDNEVGQAVDITFTDNAAWRAAISGLQVNGADINSDQYTVTEGNINIVAGVFTAAAEFHAANDYEITVEAVGYADAVVTQTLTSDFNVFGGTLTTYLGAGGDVVIPDYLGITRIEGTGFQSCTTLTSVIIPEGVTYIGDGTFWGCSNLSSVSIPGSVSSMGKSVFYQCGSLASVNIPAGVTYIGETMFRDCASLSAVTIPDSVTSIGKGAFCGCSGLPSITIPGSVTSIGEGAFLNCSGLTSVTIPEGVTAIGNDAFSGCSGLTSVTIPGSVASIGDNAFKGCTSLSSVSISEGVGSIGRSAFYGCTGLGSVTIPASVTGIGDTPFRDCTGLTAINVSPGNLNYVSDGGVLFNNLKTTIICCPAGKTGEYTVPDNVEAIGDNAFNGCLKLTGVGLPGTVTSIGNSAFRSCSGLTASIIPDSVTSIGDYAFQNCIGLNSVSIPGAVGSIGASAFRGCTGLTSANIAQGVTSIGNYAFRDCTSLTAVTIPASVTSIGSSSFNGCSSLIIYGYAGSYAESYATSKSIPFVTIDSPVAVTGVSIAEGDQTLEEGQTVQLTAVVEPANATNKEVYWHTSSAAVATVSDTGFVTAVAEGTVIITVTTANLGFTGSIAVTVVPGGTAPVAVTGVNITEDNQELAAEQAVQLTAVVVPADATNRNVSWSTSSAAVATVSDTGLLTAVAEGMATITVTTVDGSFTDSINVTVSTEPVALNITGDGVENPTGFTMSQLQAMEQYRHLYSTINTWPSKKWYAAEGVKLADLLAAAGIKEEARLIKVTATDGYRMTFTREELMDDPRYYYPGLKENAEYDGSVPGFPEGAQQVETILALLSTGSDNFDNMRASDALLLVMGQRWVTEQTNSAFVKKVGAIEVSTETPQKWANPITAPPAGIVPAGTGVIFDPVNINDMDGANFHYTTDGSDPTFESPMYNWIKSRWWESRPADLATINHPIEVNDSMTIKVVAIGFGKTDSDIVTFDYQVPLLINTGNPANATENETYTGHTFTAAGGVKPYSFALTAGALPEGMSLNGAVLEGSPAASGTFVFTVTVTDSADPAATDSREFTLVVDEAVLAAPPVLAADTTDNEVGQAIDITFSDDAGWLAAITEVSMDGTGLADDKYTVSAGKIIIAADVFTEAKDYAIVVKATGYQDATVTQTMQTTPAPNPVYTVSPGADTAYTAGTTQDGINTMTVNAGVAGFKYFTVSITPVIAHSGNETVVFAHFRNGSQLGLNATRADFDQVNIAQAGFNVQPGDVIKSYIVDDLTNAIDRNPTILQ